MIISIAGYIQIFMGLDIIEYINTWWILNGLGIETIEMLMYLLPDTCKRKYVKTVISVVRHIMCTICAIIILIFNVLWGICIVGMIGN